jgi:hypothetical protein
MSFTSLMTLIFRSPIDTRTTSSVIACSRVADASLVWAPAGGTVACNRMRSNTPAASGPPGTILIEYRHIGSLPEPKFLSAAIKLNILAARKLSTSSGRVGFVTRDPRASHLRSCSAAQYAPNARVTTAVPLPSPKSRQEE